MTRENKSLDAATQPDADSPSSPERREMVRRLAKAGVVLPMATVIYNASTTVAAAED